MSDATTAVDAAAERVRRWKAGEWLTAIYPDAKDHAMAVAALEVDWRDLSVAYLAREAAVAGLVAACAKLQAWRYANGTLPRTVRVGQILDSVCDQAMALAALSPERLPHVPQQPG
jgi:hypothetical protein